MPHDAVVAQEKPWLSARWRRRRTRLRAGGPRQTCVRERAPPGASTAAVLALRGHTGDRRRGGARAAATCEERRLPAGPLELEDELRQTRDTTRTERPTGARTRGGAAPEIGHRAGKSGVKEREWARRLERESAAGTHAEGGASRGVGEDEFGDGQSPSPSPRARRARRRSPRRWRRSPRRRRAPAGVEGEGGAPGTLPRGSGEPSSRRRKSLNLLDGPRGRTRARESAQTPPPPATRRLRRRSRTTSPSCAPSRRARGYSLRTRAREGGSRCVGEFVPGVPGERARGRAGSRRVARRARRGDARARGRVIAADLHAREDSTRKKRRLLPPRATVRAIRPDALDAARRREQTLRPTGRRATSPSVATRRVS